MYIYLYYIDYWFLFIHVYICICLCVHRWYLYIASISTFTSHFGAFGQAFRTEDGHKIRNSSEAWSWYGNMPPCAGGFNTCFLGVPCHQPIRGYIRVKGWGLSHYSWGFTCFLEFSPRKIGEMESNLTVASVSSGWEKTTTGSTRNFEILNQGKAQNMYCFDGSQPETWDI